MADGSDRASLDKTRTVLAIAMVALGVALLIIVCGVALAVSQGDATRVETTRLIFAAVLPLIGTWVGTVLAFYFTSDNLKAAAAAQQSVTESTLSLVRGLSPATPVTAIMIQVAGISPKEVVADDAAAQALKLDALYKSMKDAGRARVPVLDASGVPLYVIHEPDIDKYAARSQGLQAGQLGDDQTVAQLVADAELKAAITAFAAVAPDADVGDARTKINTDPSIKDLFVTVGGTVTTKALGWITNSDLARVG